jgi:aldose 1-epimerase
MSIPPSGEQFELSFGQQHATVVEVGGGIRSYTDGERAILHPYPVDAICGGAHGAPLIPWPNRLADGKYTFDGRDYQVDLSEPAKNNAIHGFLRWRSWQAVEQSTSRVVMFTRLHPLSGYPFMLDVHIEYVLGETGLVVVTTATNCGDATLPYGAGHHPYLSPGEGLIDDCILQLDAETRITTDPERQLPIGTEPVNGTDYDFRVGRQIGTLPIDSAFTDLRRDQTGRATIHLAGTDGRTVELWVDEAYPYIELYTADTLEEPNRRRGLGGEPMTCPPNALATGDGLIRLEPGSSFTSSWGVRLV